jgi:hypothetical protein
MDIKSAIQLILIIENLQSKQDLDIWCESMGRKKLYLYVQRLAPEHWKNINTPESYVRFLYQHMLIGYKIYK